MRLIKVKVLKSSILPFLILVVVLWACDPCTDCRPVDREPTVSLVFIDEEGADVLIDKVQIVNTGLDTVFESGIASYDAPLHYQSEETELNIISGTDEFSMTIAYDLFDEIDLDHRVLRRAQNIEVKSFSFDSLTVSCDSVNFDCDTGLVLDKETIITCYF